MVLFHAITNKFSIFGYCSLTACLFRRLCCGGRHVRVPGGAEGLQQRRPGTQRLQGPSSSQKYSDHRGESSEISLVDHWNALKNLFFLQNVIMRYSPNLFL